MDNSSIIEGVCVIQIIYTRMIIAAKKLEEIVGVSFN